MRPVWSFLAGALAVAATVYAGVQLRGNTAAPFSERINGACGNGYTVQDFYPSTTTPDLVQVVCEAVDVYRTPFSYMAAVER